MARHVPVGQGLAGIGWPGGARRFLAGLGSARHGRRGVCNYFGNQMKGIDMAKKKLEPNKCSWSKQLRVGQKSGVSVNAAVPAEHFAEVIDEILEANNGDCKPANVVSASRPTKAKTHKMLEWKDEVAAERYREEQARLALRCIVVAFETPKGESQEVRKYASVGRDNGGKSYVDTITAMSVVEDRDYILNRCLSELCAWRRRWAQYNELADAIPLVEPAVDRLRTMLAK